MLTEIPIELPDLTPDQQTKLLAQIQAGCYRCPLANPRYPEKPCDPNIQFSNDTLMVSGAQISDFRCGVYRKIRKFKADTPPLC